MSKRGSIGSVGHNHLSKLGLIAIEIQGHALESAPAQRQLCAAQLFCWWCHSTPAMKPPSAASTMVSVHSPVHNSAARSTGLHSQA